MPCLPKGPLVFPKRQEFFQKGTKEKICFRLKVLYNEEKVKYSSGLVVQESVFLDVGCLGSNTDIEVVYGEFV